MSIVDQVETLFDDEKYVEARTAAEAALKDPSNLDQSAQKQLKLFIRKCNLHAPPAAAAQEEKKEEAEKPAAVKPEATKPTTEETTTSSAAPAAAAAAPAPAPAPARPAPLARHEWYQTSNSITFTFYVKDRTPDLVKLKHTNRSLEVSIPLPDSDKVAEFVFDPFYMEIKNNEITTNVTKYKVEVKVPKVADSQWPTLELKSGTQAVSRPVDVLPKTQAELNYPNSSAKRTDWSKFSLNEEEEKKEGDAALNDLFKKIYANADDDTRRAMVKSYQESGGTTLSTNWENVGKEYVKPEAPKGMEVKNWKDGGI